LKIAILSSPNQWFIPYAKALSKRLKAPFYENHKDIKNADIIFVLSYHKIIEKEFLNKASFFIIHASNLPQGKGWSPLFWQVLEGKKEIVFTLFKASVGVDSGDIYLQKTLKLTGLELFDKLRSKQGQMCVKMCIEFLKNYSILRPISQKLLLKKGAKESFYTKRSPKNSKLDINKSLDENFNLLRICDNENFPAFFYKNGVKFIIKIYSISTDEYFK